MDSLKLLTRGTKFNHSKFKKDIALTNGSLESPTEEDIQKVSPITNEAEATEYRKKIKSKVVGDSVPFPITSFSDLATLFNVDKSILKAVEDCGFNQPTPIQSECIPILCDDRQLFAIAPTGSGKTLAFLIPLIHSLKSHSNVGPRAVILSPTKELAEQIYKETLLLTQKINSSSGLKPCFLNKSKVSLFSRDKSAYLNYDILISTPLLLIHSLDDSNSTTNPLLSNVKHIFLDEADKLFETGFLQQTDKILAGCSSVKLQIALFSATIPSGVEQIAKSIMNDPIRVVIGRKDSANIHIQQNLVYTGSEYGKLVQIRKMIANGGFTPPVIIFVQSIIRAKALYHELLYDEINVDVIHGELSAVQRENVINSFKQGKVWVLICTDILSRGIDIKGVNLVINYDIPNTPQDYVHRIGRTGRAGKNGKAITFFTKEDEKSVKLVINVMKESGCVMDEWMKKLGKLSKKDKKEIKTHQTDRDSISSVPHLIREKRKKKLEMIKASKKRKQINELENSKKNTNNEEL